jgi:hypothetical protein
VRGRPNASSSGCGAGITAKLIAKRISGQAVSPRTWHAVCETISRFDLRPPVSGTRAMWRGVMN